MARSGWLNQNEYRAFPFYSGIETLLPYEIIVDCGIRFGSNSYFDPQQHRVWLATVSLAGDGNTVTFAFDTDAPGCGSTPLVFTRHLDSSGEYANEFAEAWNADAACGSGDPAWSGYLLTGKLDALALLIAAGQHISGTAYVEPALIQSAANQYVRTISIANRDRTRIPPDDCSCNPLGNLPLELINQNPADKPLLVGASCLTGAFAFRDGYNCQIIQDPAANTITIAAVVGGGEGHPCEEVPVFQGETAVPYHLLDGSVGCGSAIRSINGIGGPNITITPGQGVSISSRPELSYLIIDVDLHDSAAYIPPESQ